MFFLHQFQVGTKIWTTRYIQKPLHRKFHENPFQKILLGNVDFKWLRFKVKKK